MCYKSAGSATSVDKPLIVVLVVMLFATCMAVDNENTENVEHHYRRLEHLAAANTLASTKSNFTSSTNVVSGEERANPLIGKMETLLNEFSSNSNVRKYLHDSKLITSREDTIPHGNILLPNEFQVFKLALVKSVNEDKKLVSKIRDELGLAGLAKLAYLKSFDHGSKEWSRSLMAWLIRQASEEEISAFDFFWKLKLDEVEDVNQLFDGRIVLWVGAIQRRARLQVRPVVLETFERNKRVFDRNLDGLVTAPGFLFASLHLVQTTVKAFVMLHPRLFIFRDADIRAHAEIIRVLQSNYISREFLKEAFRTRPPEVNWFVAPTFRKLQAACRGDHSPVIAGRAQ